ncbi:MAG: tRNA (N6-isopentenyl adenosine(37)-C2)-methylthiotransferase MiaB, partial [Deltaproteobacteria bacterium]|nr:tRNA (N6-isopentenyl adenosine(37)-C2)-methylthiotransferase MiaB [Deltaproteobacteria bacterium]
ASRRGGDQVSGRDRFNRVVNVDLSPGQSAVPGDRISVRIFEASPHSLVARPLAG